jgi:hypothetical protein
MELVRYENIKSDMELYIYTLCPVIFGYVNQREFDDRVYMGEKGSAVYCRNFHNICLLWGGVQTVKS